MNASTLPVVRDITFDLLHSSLQSKVKPHTKMAEAALFMVSVICREKGMSPEEVDANKLLDADHEFLVVMRASSSQAALLPWCHKLCEQLGAPHQFRNYAVGVVQHPLVVQWIQHQKCGANQKYCMHHAVSQFLRYMTGTVEFRRYLPENFPFVMLERRHLTDYRRHLLVRIQRGQYKENGARKVVQFVVRFIRWCQEQQGILTGLDLGRISIKKGPERPRLVPSHEACRRFFDFLQQQRIHPTIRLCLLLILATGARPGEILQLTLNDIDIASQSIRLQSKGGAERWVPLGPNTWNLLSLQMERTGKTDDAIMQVRGKHLSYTTLKAVFKRASDLSGAGIDGMTALRHRWATDALEVGMNWPKVCYLLGHKNPDELHRYQHLHTNLLFQEAGRAFTKRGMFK